MAKGLLKIDEPQMSEHRCLTDHPLWHRGFWPFYLLAAAFAALAALWVAGRIAMMFAPRLFAAFVDVLFPPVLLGVLTLINVSFHGAYSAGSIFARCARSRREFWWW